MQGDRRFILFITIVLILSFSFQGFDSSKLQIDYISDSQIAVEEGWTEVIIADIGESVGARALETGDIDSDSLNEVVVGLRTLYGPQLIYYEQIAEEWVETVLAEDFLSIHTLSIGNLDDDGDNEILVGGSGIEFANSELCYFELDSDEWVLHNITDPDLLIMSTAIGDLDNDGVNEVAAGFIHQDVGYELRYYEYNGGTWTEFNVDDDLGECDGIEIADIDQDGENELIYLGSSLTYEALCYYDYNDGSWNKTIIRCPTGWGMDTGDVDNDGDIEIAWGNYFEPENEVRIFDYVDDSWIEVNVSDMVGCATGTGIFHVAIGDVDNDGLNELAIGAERALYQVRYTEYEAGVWIEHNIASTPFPVEVIEIADVDDDGSNEILVGLSYYGPTYDEIRYYKRTESTTTTSDTTTTTSATDTTTTTSTTSDSGQLDPLLLAVGIAAPIGVILIIVLWKFRKKS